MKIFNFFLSCLNFMFFNHGFDAFGFAAANEDNTLHRIGSSVGSRPSPMEPHALSIPHVTPPHLFNQSWYFKMVSDLEYVILRN